MCAIFKIHGVASLCNPTLLLVSPDILHQAATNNIYHFFVPNECVHCKIKSSAGNIKARHDHKHGLIKKSIHLKDMFASQNKVNNLLVKINLVALLTTFDTLVSLI